MKTSLPIVALFLAPYAVADEAADRGAIESIVASLDERAEPSADLFTTEAKAAGEPARLSELRRILLAPRRPMSEMSEPHLLARSIRFLAPDVAVVDAEISQVGPMSFRVAPVLLVMQKKPNWRIAMIRVYRSPSPLARYSVAAPGL
jgi:hypothetical protein